MKKLNVLYIHSHDTGRYVSPYGYAVPTPNIQRFAEQSVLFRKAFCANPTCSPSRAALLTGQCAHSAGMFGLAHRGFAMADYNQHINFTLKKAGYTTALSGVQHVTAKDRLEVLGYDRLLVRDEKSSETIAQAAADFLRGEHDQPFFLSVGFFDTHRRFPPVDADEARYVLPPAPLPDSPRVREDFAGFVASAKLLDDGIGTVLDALDKAGLADSTIVILTTDHGIAFPDMKCNLTDHGIGVMLMLRGPEDCLRGGRVIDAMVSHTDLFPTICELIGIDKPAWLQGNSLLPLLRGDCEQLHETIFAEVNVHAAVEPMRCVRSERYKYIRRFQPRDLPVLPNCDAGQSKSLWLEHNWKDHPVQKQQLYDLVFDPGESHNLIDDPRYADVLQDLRQRLDRWMRDTHDPLCEGYLPLPAGAVLNPQDGLDPRDADTVTLSEPCRIPCEKL